MPLPQGRVRFTGSRDLFFAVSLSADLKKMISGMYVRGTGEAYPGEDGQGGAALWGKLSPELLATGHFETKDVSDIEGDALGPSLFAGTSEGWTDGWGMRKTLRLLTLQIWTAGGLTQREALASQGRLWLDVTCQIFSPCVCFECADDQVTHGAGRAGPHARTFTFALEFLPGTGTSSFMLEAPCGPSMIHFHLLLFS